MSDPAPAGLRLRFLGSGDAFGSGGRLQTCLCLEGPGGRVLIDCGATALVAMKRAGIDPASVGSVLLSHLPVWSSFTMASMGLRLRRP
jgi:ribonuclease BN (tRNA processing enzyme)